MFICYEKERNVYLKSSEYDSEELVGFIQGFSQNDMTMCELLEKVIIEDDIYGSVDSNTLVITRGISSLAAIVRLFNQFFLGRG